MSNFTAATLKGTKLIDGKELARQQLATIQAEVRYLWEKHQLKPKIAVILVGEDPASRIYVSNKLKTGSKIGIDATLVQLPATVTEQALLAQLQVLNADPHTQAILVQLPLPEHLDSAKIMRAINPMKDVDGFHPDNAAALYLNNSSQNFIPCTALACYKMLESLAINLQGTHVVVLGRSTIVGKPVAMLLQNWGNASVTMLHSHSHAPAQLASQAELLISAVGKPEFIDRQWVKQGAVVLDVGINRLASGKLCGDADFRALLGWAKAITPVPGGVGPMTIAMLMNNCVRAAKISLGQNGTA